MRGWHDGRAPLALLVLAVSAWSPVQGAVAAAREAAGVRVVVTTTSDAADGDTSSAARLMANPGPDGISLREAIEVANNDRGRCVIRFSPELAGRSIEVGSETGQDLPPIFGGGVTIDGDTDGDGRPDVTLVRTLSDSWCNCGLAIASSDNQIRGLAIRGFRNGVLFWAMVRIDDQEFATRRTYANNKVRRLALEDIRDAGIAFRSYYFGCVERACRTFNRWVDTTISGNTIRSRTYGVDLAFESSIGDRAARLRITDNDITITGPPGTYDERIGINLSAGFWIESTDNRISDLLIEGNSISVRGSTFFATGIRAWSGEAGASRNTIARLRITGNHIQVAPGSSGISMGTGDGATTDIDPDLRPIRYPEGNVVRDLEIRDNLVSGAMSEAVLIQNSCCGGADNRIRDVRIQDNRFQASGRHPQAEKVPFVGIRIEGATPGDGPERATTRNSIIGISIEGNEITSAMGGVGVGVVAGSGRATRNEVRCIRIADNTISRPLEEVSVVANTRGAYENVATLECPGQSGTDVSKSEDESTEGARAQTGGSGARAPLSSPSGSGASWLPVLLGSVGAIVVAGVMLVRARGSRRRRRGEPT